MRFSRESWFGRVIDVHAHAFPDDLAATALQKLASSSGITPRADGRLGSLIASMDRNGIAVSAIQSVATTPHQAASIRRWSESARSPRLVAFPSVHPDSPVIQEDLLAIAGSGFPGIKLHPEYQGFHVDDDRVAPLYATCRDQGLVVFFHAGEDLSFPVSDRASPRRIARVADSFPGLTMVAAHLGGWRRWDETREHLLGRDIYLDTAYVREYLPDDRCREILVNHREDRLLFGSDTPWDDQGEALGHLVGLDLPPRLLERLLFLNARSLLRLEPS